MEGIQQAYDIATEYPTVWNESEEPPLDGGAGTTSKKALINQMITNLKSSSTSTRNDEVDPIGNGRSVMQSIQMQGLDLDNLPEDITTYLPSSTEFNARSFLSIVHRGSSFDDLQRQLNQLKSSIQKKAKREVHVGEDFEQFVTTKTQLDDILATVSGQASDGLPVHHLIDHLDEAVRSYTLLMRPLENASIVKDRYTNALVLAKNFKYVLELPATLSKHIKSRDHLDFVRDWRTGRDYLLELKESSDSKDCQDIASEIETQVHDIVASYRAFVWKQLMQSQVDKMYTRYLEMLNDLEVEQNPLFTWMNHQVMQIHKGFSEFFDHAHQKISALHRNERQQLDEVDVVRFIKQVGVEDSHLDTSDVIEHWVTLQQLFVTLQQLVNKAMAFWKECNHIICGRKIVGSLVLSPQQETEIKQKFISIVEGLAGSLATFLRLDENSEVTESYTPHNSNVLSAAKYLKHIYLMLLELDSEIQVPQFSQIVERSRLEFIKLLSSLWLRDSRALGALQPFTKLDGQNYDIVKYVRAFHRLILADIVSLNKTGAHPDATLVQALNATYHSFYNHLGKLVASEHTSDNLSPQAIDREAQLLITMSNLINIQQEVVPSINHYFHQLHGTVLDEATKRNFDATASHLSDELFNHYTSLKRSQIAKIFAGCKSSDWNQESDPQNISQYVFEALMLLVEIHAKFSIYCPDLLSKVLEVPYNYILTYFLRTVREFDQLGRLGALQLVADLSYLKSVMQYVHQPADERLVGQITEAIQSISGQSLWSSRSRPFELVRPVVEMAIDREKLAYACFMRR